MRKFSIFLLLGIIIIWLAISMYWTGSQKSKSQENQNPTITPTEEIPTVTPSPESTESSLFVATSSSVRLVAPTVSVDLRY